MNRRMQVGIAAATLLAAAPQAQSRSEVVRAQRQEPGGRAGAVHGVVRFEGSPPAAVAVDMSGNTYCSQQHGDRPVMVNPFQVGSSGGLEHVVVYVTGPVNGGSRALPTDPVVLDQKSCTYDPPVLALAVNQPLLIRNSDAVLHNVHVHTRANPAFNIAQPRPMETRRSFALPEQRIAITCDVHSWMASAMAVFNHAYFTVTAPDGTFSIDGLPPGEYTLEAWHPRLGTQSARIDVPAAGTAQATFVFRGA